METGKKTPTSPRREFLGSLAAGAATIGLAAMALPVNLAAAPMPGKENNDISEADAWFGKLKGKHRIVFDATRPHEIMPFAWPKVFLLTNQKTGSTAEDCGVVVVLRHDAIPYAFEDRLWAKYKFGEMFKADDPATKAAAVRNPFWMTKPGDFVVPGLGEVKLGIKDLQADGIMFCVCDAAITVYSAVAAKQMNMDAAVVKKDWMDGLIPGIQPVPSGVWAVGRAQENQCAYCFAG
jgi:intracellular sulfur oxidation DsrE/DsrF family protein